MPRQPVEAVFHGLFGDGRAAALLDDLFAILGHARILDAKLLDVKLLRCLYS